MSQNEYLKPVEDDEVGAAWKRSVAYGWTSPSYTVANMIRKLVEERQARTGQTLQEVLKSFKIPVASWK